MRYVSAGEMYPIRFKPLHQDKYVVIEHKTQTKVTLQTYDIIRLAKKIDCRVSFDFDAIKVLRKSGFGVFKIFEEKSLTSSKKFVSIKLHKKVKQVT